MIDSSSQIISEPNLHNLILPCTSGGREGPAPRLVVEEEGELSAGVTPEKITSFPGQPMELFPDIMPNKHQVVQKESYGDVLMRRINEPECEPATKEMSRACEDSFEHRISKLELDLANQIEHEKEDMLKLSDGTTVPAIDIERILKMHLDVAEHVMVVGSGCDILCCMLTLKTKVSEAAASGEDPLGTAKDELSDAALALARQHGSEATTVHKARTCSKFCVEGLLPLIAKANAEINVSVQQVRCCAVLTSAFSQKTGELKPDGSLNRAFIMKQNKNIIDGWYPEQSPFLLGVLIEEDMVPGFFKIASLHPQGLAARDGRIRPGDRLLNVNGFVCSGQPREHVDSLMQQTSGTRIPLLVGRYSINDDSYTEEEVVLGVLTEEERKAMEERSRKERVELQNARKKASSQKSVAQSEIIQQKNCRMYGENLLLKTVLLNRKSSSNLAAETDTERTGIGIVFGRPLVGPEATLPYRIGIVLPDGPAHQSGLIKAGDWLHEVNGIKVIDMTIEQITSLVLGKPSSPVTITISTPDRPIDLPRFGYDERTVLLNRKSSSNLAAETDTEKTGIGITFWRPPVGPKTTLPYRIANVLTDGPAHQSGLIKAGDWLHEVNGVKVIDMTIEQITSLVLGKPSSPVTITISTPDRPIDPPRLGCDERTVLLNRKSSSNLAAETDTEKTGIGIVFGRPLAGPKTTLPYRIANVLTDGPAHQSGLIKAGDWLHEVNGVKVIDMTIEQITSLILGKPSSPVTITISTPDRPIDPPRLGSPVASPQLMQRLTGNEDIGSVFVSSDIVFKGACQPSGQISYARMKEEERIQREKEEERVQREKASMMSSVSMTARLSPVDDIISKHEAKVVLSPAGSRNSIPVSPRMLSPVGSRNSIPPAISYSVALEDTTVGTILWKYHTPRSDKTFQAINEHG